MELKVHNNFSYWNKNKESHNIYPFYLLGTDRKVLQKGYIERRKTEKKKYLMIERKPT